MENLIQKKIEHIKKNKESAILAITSYLDTIYNMTDKFFDTSLNKDGTSSRTLKKGLEPDEKIEKFIQELNDDAQSYEKIRRKIQLDDFNLSLTEIARIGLCFVYAGARIDKQLQAYLKAQQEIKETIELLMEGETQKVDFSKDK